MVAQLVKFFINRHLLTNMIFIAVIVGGLMSWQSIKKEERPDITFDVVRITAHYPGATAEEVEHFVTRELESELKGVDGVYRITSSVSRGAELNGMSQSAASQFLRQLEKDLGAELLDRTKRPLKLTRAGKLFHEASRDIVRCYDEARSKINSLKGELVGSVRVAPLE